MTFKLTPVTTGFLDSNGAYWPTKEAYLIHEADYFLNEKLIFHDSDWTEINRKNLAKISLATKLQILKELGVNV